MGNRDKGHNEEEPLCFLRGTSENVHFSLVYKSQAEKKIAEIEKGLKKLREIIDLMKVESTNKDERELIERLEKEVLKLLIALRDLLLYSFESSFRTAEGGI